METQCSWKDFITLSSRKSTNFGEAYMAETKPKLYTIVFRISLSPVFSIYALRNSSPSSLKYLFLCQ